MWSYRGGACTHGAVRNMVRKGARCDDGTLAERPAGAVVTALALARTKAKQAGIAAGLDSAGGRQEPNTHTDRINPEA